MENNNTLEYIANGFHAAHRIRNLYTSNINRSSELSVLPSDITTLSEVLKIICDYLPEINKAPLNRAIDQSNLYSEAIRNLKKHVATSRGQKFDMNNVARTLSIVQPLLGDNHKALLQKLIKIYEIMNL